jgi:chemotaxis protein MotA
MKVSRLLGLLLVVGVLGLSVFLSPGANVLAFVDLPALVCVVGGSIAAAVICYPLANVLRTPGVALGVVMAQPKSERQLVAQLVEFSQTARRDGLLALDKQIEALDNRLLKLGLQMAIDGTRPEVIEEILRSEMLSVSLRHRETKAVLDQFGRFAPAFGMIGTLMGLVIMLGNMTDPASIGGGIAVALLTTLYGAVLANGLALPLAERLAYRSRLEALSMEIILRGVLAIQSGDHPRVIQQRLYTYLAPNARAA